MDCANFESTLIDELYGELDEITSAAAKQHAAGCAKCAALLDGLKATRRLAVLPMVSPSADFEDRILAAAKDAEKVVPIIERGRPHVLSSALRVAMRPQVAMAALFLIMVGSGALFMRGQTEDAPTATALGAPAGPPPAESAAPAVAVPPPPVATAAAPPAAVAAATREAPADVARLNRGDGTLAQNSLAAKSAYGAPAVGGAAASAAPASAFDSAMALYQAASYGDATRAFDALAPGDARAALMAARSVRDGNGGCAAATGRFDAVASRPDAAGTGVGYDAVLEGGHCLRLQGSNEAARARFRSLLSLPGYASRAQTELDALSQGEVAASKEDKAAPVPRATMAPPASPPAQRKAAPSKPKAINQSNL